jgi:hypothetical protein
MTKELIFIIERFPAYQLKIVDLYQRDQDFRQLCNDYCLSENMLEAFRKTEPDFRKVQHDYEQVSKDLKTELLHFFTSKN